MAERIQQIVQHRVILVSQIRRLLHLTDLVKNNRIEILAEQTVKQIPDRHRANHPMTMKYCQLKQRKIWKINLNWLKQMRPVHPVEVPR